MFGSGVVTGMMQAITVVLRRTIRQDLQLALTVCFVAVAGAAMLRTVAVLIASTPRPTGSAPLASVWPYSKFFPKKKQEKRNKSQSEVIPRRWRAEPPQAEK